MGASGSRDVLVSFYLPVFIAVAAGLWVLATQKPMLLKDTPVPDIIQRTYRHSPIQFAICASLVVTLLLTFWYKDVQWSESTLMASDLMSGGSSYFGELLPPERYGLDNTTGANPNPASTLTKTAFNNSWASGPGPSSGEMRRMYGGPGPLSQGRSP